MKIKFGKLLRIVGQLVAAAPTIVAAVRPVIAEVKKPKAAGTAQADTAPQVPGGT